MTEPEIKDIFSRFQNLNLIVLIEDLKNDQVARNYWADRFLCPLAHGWSGRGVKTFGSCEAYAAASIGVGISPVWRFLSWWDLRGGSNGALLGILQSILAERQADADAVQAVLEHDRRGQLGHDGMDVLGCAPVAGEGTHVRTRWPSGGGPGKVPSLWQRPDGRAWCSRECWEAAEVKPDCEVEMAREWLEARLKGRKHE